MVTSNVQLEYDDRTVSGRFRAKRDQQTQTGRLNNLDPEAPAPPNLNPELVYGQPAQVG